MQVSLIGAPEIAKKTGLIMHYLFLSVLQYPLKNHHLLLMMLRIKSRQSTAKWISVMSKSLNVNHQRKVNVIIISSFISLMVILYLRQLYVVISWKGMKKVWREKKWKLYLYWLFMNYYFCSVVSVKEPHPSTDGGKERSQGKHRKRDRKDVKEDKSNSSMPKRSKYVWYFLSHSLPFLIP